jgi:hypothetical protein
MTSRRDPFAGPRIVFVLMVAVAALQLLGLIRRAYANDWSPVVLTAPLAVLQFVLILGAPLVAGIRWGRGQRVGEPADAEAP